MDLGFIGITLEYFMLNISKVKLHIISITQVSLCLKVKHRA